MVPFSLRTIVTGDFPQVSVVDVGAAEYGKDPYHSLTAQGLCRVIGFEPNEPNCAKRNQSAALGHRYLPYALGRGDRRKFYSCANPLTSSLYRPNAALLDKFQHLQLPVVGESELQTHRMEDLSEIEDIDYLKLDVQGAELDVIEGATRRMDDVLVVHTEIEFIPMYEDQPLFGDIDVALRRHGLLLHKMDGITGRAMKPLISNGNPYGPLSQWLYADAAIYVRSFMTFDQLSPEKLLKLALILHDVYGSFDLAALALEAHDAKTGQGLWTAYLTRLGASPST